MILVAGGKKYLVLKELDSHEGEEDNNSPEEEEERGEDNSENE